MRSVFPSASDRKGTLHNNVLARIADGPYFQIMAPVIPLRPRKTDPPEMQARAMDNLSYIRGMMEQAATFTAVSGWGQVVIGITAVVAALVAARQGLPWARVATWVA